MPLLLDHPAPASARTVGGVADEALGLEAEAFFDPIDHRLGRLDLRCAMARRRLHVDDDPGLQIDQVVRRVGEEGWPARAPVQRAAGSVSEMFFGTLGLCLAAGLLVECLQILAHRARAAGRRPAAQSIGSLPGTPRCRLASALMTLASIAKPSPPTSPSAMQRRSDGLEHMAEGVAVAEAAMPVLREGRVVRDASSRSEAAEPAIGQVQMHLFAQPPLGSDAEAVADDQHADHQLRIDRGPAGVAVEGGEVMAQIAEVEEAIDARAADESAGTCSSRLKA